MHTNRTTSGNEPPVRLDDLGDATDLRTAAQVLGIGKSTAYKTARAGTFPCRVVQIGSRWVVPTAGLRDLLGRSA